MKNKTLEERFWEKVNKNAPNGCWEWTAFCYHHGYGYFGGKDNPFKYAHRFSYAPHLGSFDKDLCILHRCDNPKCVNPEHLFIGTQNTNMKDKVKKNRQNQKTTLS